MDIVSTLLPPEDGVVLLVMDARVDGKNLVISLGVGDLRRDRMSEIGNACLHKLAAHHAANYPDGSVHMVEIRIPAHATARVEQAFARAREGDAVMFVCRTSDLYDQVFPLLGFKHAGYSSH